MSHQEEIIELWGNKQIYYSCACHEKILHKELNYSYLSAVLLKVIYRAVDINDVLRTGWEVIGRWRPKVSWLIRYIFGIWLRIFRLPCRPASPCTYSYYGKLREARYCMATLAMRAHSNYLVYSRSVLLMSSSLVFHQLMYYLSNIFTTVTSTNIQNGHEILQFSVSISDFPFCPLFPIRI